MTPPPLGLNLSRQPIRYLRYQADLKTFEAWRCYGSSVLTGLTAQNTTGVKGVHEVPAEFVIQQASAEMTCSPHKRC